jgi:hypothetical protein
MNEPLAVARDVFDRMGAKMSEEDEAAIGGWLADNKRENFAPHLYDYDTFGLSEELIQSDYARYIERHCA